MGKYLPQESLARQLEKFLQEWEYVSSEFLEECLLHPKSGSQSFPASKKQRASYATLYPARSMSMNSRIESRGGFCGADVEDGCDPIIVLQSMADRSSMRL